MGSLVEFSVDDIATTIESMAKSKEFFLPDIGKKNLFLSEEGFRSFFDIYIYLEKVLLQYLKIPVETNFNNRNWHFNLIETLKDPKLQDLLSKISESLSKIPLISNSNLLIHPLYIKQSNGFLSRFLTINCYYNLEELSLVHHKLLLKCPCLTTCLGITPLEKSSGLYMKISTVDPHYVLTEVTEVFRKIFC